MFREFTLAIALIATPALAQTSATPDLTFDEATSALRANSTPWPYAGENSFAGETRVRASSLPGVCELDRFTITPGREPGSGIPRAITVEAATFYGLMAIEPQGWDREEPEREAERDLACYRWGAENRVHLLSEDVDTVWAAGQIIQALAHDVATGQQPVWGCTEVSHCLSREQGPTVLRIANLKSVRRDQGECPSAAYPCVTLEFHDREGDGVWQVTVEPDGNDSYRSPHALWKWREAAVDD